ncbi:Uncharacterised protein [Mycobacteroides abscessus subsp. abscessus]|nr:Uncharacterised protein [Mycobacteroides abscessus subsp. abscessus]
MVAVRKVGRGDYDGIGQFQQRIDIGDRGTAVGVGEGLGGTGIDIQYTHQFGRFEGVQRASVGTGDTAGPDNSDFQHGYCSFVRILAMVSTIPPACGRAVTCGWAWRASAVALDTSQACPAQASMPRSLPLSPKANVRLAGTCQVSCKKRAISCLPAPNGRKSTSRYPSGSPAAGLQWLTLIARECAAVACRNDQTRLSSSRFSVTARR